MAAAGIAILLDDAYLRGDAFGHSVGVAYDADFLTLRGLEHSEGVDNRCECVGVEGAEAFVDEEVLEGDVP